MSKTKFVLNRDGVKELLKGPEMKSIILDYGEQVQSAAGGDYKVELVSGENRVWATISPDSIPAYYSNLKHNTLLKALGSLNG